MADIRVVLGAREQAPGNPLVGGRRGKEGGEYLGGTSGHGAATRHGCTPWQGVFGRNGHGGNIRIWRREKKESGDRGVP